MKSATEMNGTPACFRVLGVDPASAGPTGFGIVESDGQSYRVLHYGAWKSSPKRRKSSPGAVLRDVHESLCKLLTEYQPHAMAVESVFAALNLQTALRLSEVRGVVLLAAEQHAVTTHSYSPREIKACVAGYGHADKKQMQLMVRALLKMKEVPQPADAADALAVAVCHIQAKRYEERFGLSTPSLKSSPAVRVGGRAIATNEPVTRATSERLAGIQSRQ